MDIREIRDLITQAFSATGLQHGSYTVYCPPIINVAILGNSDKSMLHIKFGGNLPKLSVKKIITLSIELEEIYMDSDGGKIKLRHFPDIRFNFDDEDSELVCGSTNEGGCLPIFAGLSDEVDEKYGLDATQQKIAQKVLRYCEAWAIMSMEGGVDFAGMDSKSRRQMKKQCVAFVHEQMKEELHGSILVLILVQFVLPYIIRWIAERIIDRLINA